MKKLQLIQAVACLVFAMAGCQKDDDRSVLPIQSYQYASMHHIWEKWGVGVDVAGEDRVRFVYLNGKIAKRVGGFRSVVASEGAFYPYMFTTQIYDTLIYSGNQIIIRTYSENPQRVYAGLNERHISLDGNGRMIRQIVPAATDTTDYQYDSKGRLKGSCRRYYTTGVDTVSYYYTGSNLDSLVRKVYQFSNLMVKDVESFSGYDRSANPVRNMSYFSETFNRSLSANNYTFYRFQRFAPNGILGDSYTRSWTLTYDAEGNVVF